MAIDYKMDGVLKNRNDERCEQYEKRNKQINKKNAYFSSPLISNIYIEDNCRKNRYSNNECYRNRCCNGCNTPRSACQASPTTNQCQKNSSDIKEVRVCSEVEVIQKPMRCKEPIEVVESTEIYVERESIGRRGPRGFRGYQGPTGPRGERGDMGPAGDPGCPGAMGPRGNPGPMGPPGPVGARGPKGDIGPMGYRGPEGPEGPQGMQGLMGPEGPIGPEGPEGQMGPQGPIGPKGCQGSEGPQGVHGDQGPTGPTGPTGPAGSLVGAQYQLVYQNEAPYTIPKDDVIKLNTEVASGLPDITYNNLDGVFTLNKKGTYIINFMLYISDILGDKTTISLRLNNNVVCGYDISKPSSSIPYATTSIVNVTSENSELVLFNESNTIVFNNQVNVIGYVTIFSILEF